MMSAIFPGGCNAAKSFINIAVSEIITTTAFSILGISIFCFLYFHDRIMCSALFVQQTMYRINYSVQKLVEFITSCIFKFVGIFLFIFRTFSLIALYLVCLRQIIKNKLLESRRLIQLNRPSLNTDGVLQKDGNEMSFEMPELIPSISDEVEANEPHRADNGILAEYFQSHKFLTLIDVDDIHFACLRQSSDASIGQGNTAHGTSKFDTTFQTNNYEQIDPSKIINEADETAVFSVHVPTSETQMGPSNICNISELERDSENNEPHFTILNTNQQSRCLNETFPNKNFNQSNIMFKEQINEFEQCEVIQRENNQFDNCNAQNIETNRVKSILDNEQTSRKDDLNTFEQNVVPYLHKLERLPHQKQSNVMPTTCTSKENFVNEPLTSQLDSKTPKENLTTETKSFVPISPKSSFDSNIWPTTKHAPISDLPSGMSSNLCTTELVPLDENRFNSNVKEVVNRIDLRFIYALK